MDPSQLEYLKGISTELAIHSVVKSVHASLNNGKVSAGIFIDVQIAFDTLDCGILLDKHVLRNTRDRMAMV